jgi:hypothetical protein
MTLESIVAFDTIVEFVMPLVALLMSLPMMWFEEHLWNASVLQRVHLSNLLYTCNDVFYVNVKLSL